MFCRECGTALNSGKVSKDRRFCGPCLKEIVDGSEARGSCCNCLFREFPQRTCTNQLSPFYKVKVSDKLSCEKYFKDTRA